MMNHLTEEQLNLYLDQTLSPPEQKAVEKHLAACSHCQAEFRKLENLFTVLAALEPIPLAADLSNAVVGDLVAERNQQKRRWYAAWLIAGLQAAGIILVGWLGWLAFYSQVGPYLIAASEAAGRAGAVMFWQGLRLPTLMEQILAGLRSFIDLSIELSLVSTTSTQLLVIVLAAGLLWLAGNSIILRQILSDQNHHRT